MAADKRAARLGVLALVATLLFGAIGARLWFVQTVQADSLQATVDQSKVRRVPLIPERGRIFDAWGRILADNDRLLTVSVDWEVLRRDTDRAELFSRLSGWLEMPVEEMEERYDSDDYSRYRPMPLKEGVDEPVAIGLGERAEDFPGVTVETDWERTYPYAPMASHVVGYMGAITKEDADRYRELGYDVSKGGEDVGRSGVELSMEQVLHGQWGERIVEIDARNRIVREISRTEPVNGNDIQLSIDLGLQQYAERALQTQLQFRRQFFTNNYLTAPDGVRTPFDLAQPEAVPYKAPAGSVIVMNQVTGQISAMASYPTFDNRWFSAEVGSEKFDQLFPTPVPGGPEVDPDLSSLANRAIQGQYNMGSAFKVFVAYAALATGLIRADTEYDDQGTYKLQRVDPKLCAEGVKCEYRNSLCGDGAPCRYGLVDLPVSLAVSSDAYYYRLGEEFYYAPGTQLQDQVRQ
ncbi:MAG: penicillin-binding transpeptidase domain-containing protein, partial [Ilumatobacteraceae bacterium]